MTILNSPFLLHWDQLIKGDCVTLNLRGKIWRKRLRVRLNVILRISINYLTFHDGIIGQVVFFSLYPSQSHASRFFAQTKTIMSQGMIVNTIFWLFRHGRLNGSTMVVQKPVPSWTHPSHIHHVGLLWFWRIRIGTTTFATTATNPSKYLPHLGVGLSLNKQLLLQKSPVESLWKQLDAFFREGGGGKTSPPRNCAWFFFYMGENCCHWKVGNDVLSKGRCMKYNFNMTPFTPKKWLQHETCCQISYENVQNN